MLLLAKVKHKCDRADGRVQFVCYLNLKELAMHNELTTARLGRGGQAQLWDRSLQEQENGHDRKQDGGDHKLLRINL